MMTYENNPPQFVMRHFILHISYISTSSIKFAFILSLFWNLGHVRLSERYLHGSALHVSHAAHVVTFTEMSRCIVPR